MKTIKNINEGASLELLNTDLISIFGDLNKIKKDQENILYKIKLTDKGILSDTHFVSMLKEKRAKTIEETDALNSEFKDIKLKIGDVNEIVRRLKKMGTLEKELTVLRVRSGHKRIEFARVSKRLWVLQEEFYRLKKEKKQILEKHTASMKEKNYVESLHKKIIPEGDLLELKGKLTYETEGFEKFVIETKQVIEEFERLTDQNKKISAELEANRNSIPLLKEHIKGLEGSVLRVSKKVVSDEDMKALEKNVNEMKSSKEDFNVRKKELSPKIAEISTKEREISEKLEAYKLKLNKDKEKLEKLQQEMKKYNVDKGNITELKDNVTKLESELEIKRRSFNEIKKEHDEVMSANKGYKDLIDEVNAETSSLKKKLDKKKA